MRGGGGVVNLPRADNPLVFAAPVALSFGLVGPGATRDPVGRAHGCRRRRGPVGGDASSDRRRPTGVTLSVPTAVTVPGTLPVSVTTTSAPDAELSGYIVLTRGAERRRIPYWFRTGAPALGNAARTLRCAVPASTRRRRRAARSRVTRYSYPERPTGLGFAAELPGPERVFRVTLARPAVNFGVVVTSRARGVRVEPRIVHAGDERRLTGYAALPFNLNPYLRIFGDPVLAAGTILPAAGAYDVVFDSPSAARAGKFSFRYWLNDTTPPTAVLRKTRVQRGTQLVVDERRPRLRRRSGLARRARRRQGAGRPARGRTGAHLDGGLAQGQARAPAPDLGLPGVAEHGERRSDPAEHAHSHDDLRRRPSPATSRCKPR